MSLGLVQVSEKRSAFGGQGRTVSAPFRNSSKLHSSLGNGMDLVNKIVVGFEYDFVEEFCEGIDRPVVWLSGAEAPVVVDAGRQRQVEFLAGGEFHCIAAGDDMVDEDQGWGWMP